MRSSPAPLALRWLHSVHRCRWLKWMMDPDTSTRCRSIPIADPLWYPKCSAQTAVPQSEHCHVIPILVPGAGSTVPHMRDGGNGPNEVFLAGRTVSYSRFKSRTPLGLVESVGRRAGLKS